MALRKLKRYYPDKEQKYLLRGISIQVNTKIDPYRPSKKKDYSKEIKNNNIHKKEKTGIDEDAIGDDQNEMKLHTSSSVVQNLISTNKYKTPIKMENEKPKKYINIYYNNNYAYSHNKNTNSDMFNKNTKNKLLKNEYFDYYDREIADKSINQKKRIEEMEIEIPSLYQMNILKYSKY